MAEIYFRTRDGKIAEIRNWHQRYDSCAVMLALPLSSDQKTTYRAMRSEGNTDSEIWRALHADEKLPDTDIVLHGSVEPVFTISADELTEKQLMQLLRKATGHELPTIERLSGPDLVALLKSVIRSEEISVW